MVNHEDGRDEHIPASDPRARGYRTTLEADRAVAWLDGVRDRHPEQPWMLTVGFSALHTPLQPPPAELLSDSDSSVDLIGCGTPVANLLPELGVGVGVSDIAEFVQARTVAQHMLEAMDHGVGRVLVAAGVLIRGDDGRLRHNPDSDTVVVIVGDNGTYAPTVRLPFDFQRAKGTPYQTGVWVPLIVAGPVVNDPDRDVEAMVNTTDLYRLFGEIAGIDMDTRAESLQLDAQPVLPYLADPEQPHIRRFNFTEMAASKMAVTPPPCVIPAIGVCVQIFPQRGVCEDQGGIWYGTGSEADPDGFDSCCAVNVHLEAEGQDPVDIFPNSQRAIRNETYKLVRLERVDCQSGAYRVFDELYEINQSRSSSELKLDREEDDLLASGPDDLTAEEQQSYETLVDEMEALVDRVTDCPGDGNRDGRVDQLDLDEWEYWSSRNEGRSSWYDINLDGMTDLADKAIIEENLGRDCG